MDRQEKEKDNRPRGGGKAPTSRWKDRAPGPYRRMQRPRPRPVLDTARASPSTSYRGSRPASASSVIPTPTPPLVSPPVLTAQLAPRFGSRSRSYTSPTTQRSATPVRAGWIPACAVRGSCGAGRPGSRNSVDTYCSDCGAPRRQTGASGQGLRLEDSLIKQCRPGTPRPIGGVIVETKEVNIQTSTDSETFTTFRCKIVKTRLWGSELAWRFQRPVCISCYLAAASENLDCVSYRCTCPSEL